MLRDAFRQHRRVAFVAPTGFGKTVLFCHAARFNYERGNAVTIIVHRQELVEQVCRTLRGFDVPHGVLAPGFPYTEDRVQVASVFTLARRIGHVVEPRLAVIDEAHHCIPTTVWGKVAATWPRAKILGVTATPVRLDGTGLRDTFDTLVVGPSTADGIREQWLAPLKIFAPPTVDTEGIHRRFGEFIQKEAAARVDQPAITGDVIAHYRKHANGKSAIVFCASIEHARHVEAAFQAGGISSRAIDAGTDSRERARVVDAFRQRAVTCLVAVDVISEGFDVPGVLECGILLRPTSSLGLYLQQVGRCLRPKPAGAPAIILDHVGNTGRHGWPADERNWTLDGEADSSGRGRARATRGVSICKQCFAANRTGRTNCIECGAPFQTTPRHVAWRNGELVELSEAEAAAETARRQAWKTQGEARSLQALINVGIGRGYHPAKARRWAEHVIEGRMAKQQRSMRYP